MKMKLPVVMASPCVAGMIGRAASLSSRARLPAKATLVARCTEVSPATHPPCNADNPCELIIGEIKRGCLVRQDSSPGPRPSAGIIDEVTKPSGEHGAFRVWLRFLRLDQRLRVQMGRCLREVGLSIPQFDVLSALSEGAGITQRELARQLFVTKGNVSGLIDRLVEARLVERRRFAQDRRSHALFLTFEGERLAAAGFAVQEPFVDSTLGRLAPDDLAALHLLLGRWRDAAREAGERREQARQAAPRSRTGLEVNARSQSEAGSNLGHRRVEMRPCSASIDAQGVVQLGDRARLRQRRDQLDGICNATNDRSSPSSPPEPRGGGRDTEFPQAAPVGRGRGLRLAERTGREATRERPGDAGGALRGRLILARFRARAFDSSGHAARRDPCAADRRYRRADGQWLRFRLCAGRDARCDALSPDARAWRSGPALRIAVLTDLHFGGTFRLAPAPRRDRRDNQCAQARFDLPPGRFRARSSLRHARSAA